MALEEKLKETDHLNFESENVANMYEQIQEDLNTIQIQVKDLKRMINEEQKQVNKDSLDNHKLKN